MPLSSAVVGQSGDPLTQRVDARWTMAYAAGLGDETPAYFDTASGQDVPAHPLFPVCYEWPLLIDPRHLPPDSGLSVGERLRGVHATHDLVLHRPIRAGVEVTTRARVVRVEARRPGAFQVTRFDSVDGEGAPLSTTWYGTLFRGVEVVGGARNDAADAPEPPAALDLDRAAESEIQVAGNAAHVYTECARIWNPIHTDAAVAASAGLPGLILHGTATLALAVSQVVARHFGGDPARVVRVAARFAAAVEMPSRLALRMREEPGGAVRFELRNAAGQPALRNGLAAATRNAP